MLHFIFIALGGALGALSRYIIDYSVTNYFHSDFPFGTLTVNLIGCFIIGMMYRLIFHEVIHIKFSPYIITGFLGALTTFSSYAYSTLMLFEKGDYILGWLNLLANNVLGILFVFLGVELTNKTMKKYFSRKIKKDEVL